jgi:hypothetical protein
MNHHCQTSVNLIMKKIARCSASSFCGVTLFCTKQKVFIRDINMGI